MINESYFDSELIEQPRQEIELNFCKGYIIQTYYGVSIQQAWAKFCQEFRIEDDETNRASCVYTIK